MNKYIYFLTIALLITVYHANAQRDTVVSVFHLDYIRPDSFYLEITDSIFSASEKRPSIARRYVFFNDTSELRNYINVAKLDFDAIDKRRLELAKQFHRVEYTVKRMECLMDSVVYGGTCTGIGARAMPRPPVGLEQQMALPLPLPAVAPKKQPKPKARKKKQ